MAKSKLARSARATRAREQEILDPLEAQKQARIELARIDFVEFVGYVTRDEEGSSITPAPHQIAWRDHLEYCWGIGKNSAILSGMTYAKTVWIAIMLPLWLIGRNPNLRIMLVSSAEDVAAKRLQDIQRYIEFSNEYHEVFPWVKKDPARQWNQQAANVVRTGRGGGFVGSVDHSISAFGYTAKAGNGARADVILFDDVASSSNSDSEAMRKELMQYVTEQWITRSSKKPVIDMYGELISLYTIIVMIGTRYHEQDIYQALPLTMQEAYCTLIQAVSECFTHLDWKVLGSVIDPPHPIVGQYGSWSPETIAA